MLPSDPSLLRQHYKRLSTRELTLRFTRQGKKVNMRPRKSTTTINGAASP